MQLLQIGQLHTSLSCESSRPTSVCHSKIYALLVKIGSLARFYINSKRNECLRVQTLEIDLKIAMR